MDAARSRPIAFTVRGPIRPADLPGLFRRVRGILADAAGRPPPGAAARPTELVCDVATVAADATAVDALARLQLEAARWGCRIRLRNPSADLLDLVNWMGLADVLPP